MASDLLSTIGEEIDARLRELQPLLAEYERLLVAAQALDEDAELEPTVAVQAAEPALADVSPSIVRRAAPTRRATPKAARKVIREIARKAPATRVRATRARAKAPSRRSETDETILGILEHGSHTVPELLVVTAMGKADINSSLRRLRADGAIAKTEREGKLAWALAGVTA